MKRTLILIAAASLAAAIFAVCAAYGALPQGTVEGSTYTNGGAELVFSIPSGWTYSTDNEVDEIQADAGGSEKRARCDMFAKDNSTGASVMVILDNTPADFDETKYLDQIKDELERSSGDSLDFSDYTYAEIGSNNFIVLPVDYTEASMNQYYYIRRADGFIICIIATVTEGNDIDTVMANFS